MTRSLQGQVETAPLDLAAEPRAPDVPLADQHGDAVPGGPAPRGYRAVRLGLVGAQLALLTGIAAQSFFFADDFLYGSLLGSTPLTGDLLIRSWFGHLVPGFIAADWAFIHYVGLNWTVAAAIMIAVTLAATVALIRLLEALCGRVWRVLVIGGLFAFSLMLTTQVLWWGAVMTNVIPLAATIATLDAFVRWARSGRLLHLAAMTVWFLVAVSFYEKSILTAAYVGLLSLLVLDAGLPWRERMRSTLRRWPAWVLLGGIALVDVGWYLTHDYLVEAGPAPGPRDLAAFLFFSFTEGFAPSFLGVHQPLVSILDSRVLTLLLANALLLGIAVVTSLRSRVAFQAWVFFALCYLINQGVLGRGRVGLIGPHMGTLLRYQLENTVLFCIALAVAIPHLRGALPARWVPRVRGRVMSGWAVLGLLAVLLAPYWVISLRDEVRVAPGVSARDWFDTARTSLAEQRTENPDLAVVDGVVPGWLVYAQMAPFNRYERVLPQVFDDVPLTRTEERGLSFDESGEAHPVSFEPLADLDGEGTCLTPGGDAARISLKLPELLPEQLWFVDVDYTGDAVSTLRIQVDNQAAVPDLRMGTGEYETGAGRGRLVVAPATLPVAGVALEVIGPAGICLHDVRVGAMRPES